MNIRTVLTDGSKKNKRGSPHVIDSSLKVYSPVYTVKKLSHWADEVGTEDSDSSRHTLV